MRLSAAEELYVSVSWPSGVPVDTWVYNRPIPPSNLERKHLRGEVEKEGKVLNSMVVKTSKTDLSQSGPGKWVWAPPWVKAATSWTRPNMPSVESPGSIPGVSHSHRLPRENTAGKAKASSFTGGLSLENLPRFTPSKDKKVEAKGRKCPDSKLSHA